MQECKNARMREMECALIGGVLFCVPFLRNNLEITSVFRNFVSSKSRWSHGATRQPDSDAYFDAELDHTSRDTDNDGIASFLVEQGLGDG